MITKQILKTLIFIVPFTVNIYAYAGDQDLRDEVVDALEDIVGGDPEFEALVDRVVEILKEGTPELDEESDFCRRIGEAPVLLGHDGAFRACVAPQEFEDSVRLALQAMRANRLENISDYDQRVTRFHAFRGSFGTTFNSRSVKELAQVFNIDIDESQQHIEYAVEFSGNKFEALKGLFLASEYREETPLSRFAESFFGRHEQVLKISIGEELSMYLGGGLVYRHVFYISKSGLLYAKVVGWNA